ncbi:hypothetical protein [Streptomyces silaceus]|nr:hypothetical protein [Streptomyces silaceus]
MPARGAPPRTTHAYDGLLLHGLPADVPPTVDEFEEMLRQLLPGE